MGDFLTRSTVWFAVAFYIAAGFARIHGSRISMARWLSTAGLVFFLIHVAFAFHFFYRWSHSVAWEETARATEAMTGSNSGDGLYLNYLFALVWLADLAWWWIRGDATYVQRKRPINWLLHGFLLFMIVNGAVIFTSSPLRWFAATLLVALAASFFSKCLRRSGPTQPNS